MNTNTVPLSHLSLPTCYIITAPSTSNNCEEDLGNYEQNKDLDVFMYGKKKKKLIMTCMS